MTAITRTSALLDNILDLLMDAVCVVDADDRFVYVSAAFERIFGYRADEVIGRSIFDLVLPEDHPSTRSAIRRVMQGQPQPHFANRYVRKDGRIINVMWSVRWSPEDQVRIALGRDVTELKYAESMQVALHSIAEAAHAAADLPSLFERIHAIIGGLLPARNFFVALYDERQDELSFPYFVDEHDAAPSPRKLSSGTFTSVVVRSGQPLLFRRGARRLPPGVGGQSTGKASVDWLGVPLNTHDGTIGALVVQSYTAQVRYNEKDKLLLQFVSTQVATAIERKRADTWLQYIAQHDQLTDLANRELFHERLEQALARVQAGDGELATLYIDLDKFKQVNDNHGHDVGDLLLQEVARRIACCVGSDDTVARLGGDEFVVLLDQPGTASTAWRVAEQIRAAINLPYALAGRVIHLSTSIGVALCPAHGTEYRQIMRHADGAMYHVKRQGGNRVHLGTDGHPAEPLATSVAGPGCADQVGDSERVQRSGKVANRSVTSGG